MYLTDIVVNFQNYFLDYFDWNKFDKIDTLKKTFIFKVDNLENIIYFNAQFDSKFLDLIKNKTFNFLYNSIRKKMSSQFQNNILMNSLNNNIN